MIMGHGDRGRDWPARSAATFRHGREAVWRRWRPAPLDDVKKRVPDLLAARYEQPFSTYGAYRPWRTGLVANIERTYAMVS
jgi:hypothetical protein